MDLTVLTTAMEDDMERTGAADVATDGGSVLKVTSKDVLVRRPVTAEKATKEKEDEVASGGPSYRRELTVVVEQEGEEKIPMTEMLRAMQGVCGLVIGCRCLPLNRYEVTMNHPNGKQRLLDGFKIRGTSITAKDLTTDEMVVSFMGLPVYITDEEILKKLADWGVETVSPIARRKWPGTAICEGTRFARVKFNKEVRSLPWSTRFDTEKGAEYFRVIHDKQLKVCRMCIQPGHILRDCPDFFCRKCGKQGHYARECIVPTIKCKECGFREGNCVCREEESRGDAILVDPAVQALALDSESGGSGGEEREEEENQEEEMEHEELADRGTVLVKGESQLLVRSSSEESNMDAALVAPADPGGGEPGMLGGGGSQGEILPIQVPESLIPVDGVAKVPRASGQLGNEGRHVKGARLEADLSESMALATGGEGGVGMTRGKSSQEWLIPIQTPVCQTRQGDSTEGSSAGTSEVTADASHWRGMAPISSPFSLYDGREIENMSEKEVLGVCRKWTPKVRRRRGVDSDEEQRNVKKKGGRKKR